MTNAEKLSSLALQLDDPTIRQAVNLLSRIAALHDRPLANDLQMVHRRQGEIFGAALELVRPFTAKYLATIFGLGALRSEFELLEAPVVHPTNEMLEEAASLGEESWSAVRFSDPHQRRMFHMGMGAVVWKLAPLMPSDSGTHLMQGLVRLDESKPQCLEPAPRGQRQRAPLFRSDAALMIEQDVRFTAAETNIPPRYARYQITGIEPPKEQFAKSWEQNDNPERVPYPLGARGVTEAVWLKTLKKLSDDILDRAEAIGKKVRNGQPLADEEESFVARLNANRQQGKAIVDAFLGNIHFKSEH